MPPTVAVAGTCARAVAFAIAGPAPRAARYLVNPAVSRAWMSRRTRTTAENVVRSARLARCVPRLKMAREAASTRALRDSRIVAARALTSLRTSTTAALAATPATTTACAPRTVARSERMGRPAKTSRARPFAAPLWTIAPSRKCDPKLGCVTTLLGPGAIAAGCLNNPDVKKPPGWSSDDVKNMQLQCLWCDKTKQGAAACAFGDRVDAFDCTVDTCAKDRQAAPSHLADDTVCAAQLKGSICCPKLAGPSSGCGTTLSCGP